MLRILTIVTMVFAFVATPAAGTAQLSNLAVGSWADRDTLNQRGFAILLIPASLGAAIGSVAGFQIGQEVGRGGGGDPGLTSALILGALGGGLGSFVFTNALADPPADASTGVAATLVGILAGTAGAFLVSRALDANGPAIFAGYSLGQGAVTAGMIATRRAQRNDARQ